MQGVYLIHFDRPYEHAEHYLGYSSDIEKRLSAHAKGNGSRLMEVITQAGIPWRIARLWPGADRSYERRMHRQGPKRLCPICDPKAINRKKELCQSATHPSTK